MNNLIFKTAIFFIKIGFWLLRKTAAGKSSNVSIMADIDGELYGSRNYYTKISRILGVNMVEDAFERTAKKVVAEYKQGDVLETET